MIKGVPEMVKEKLEEIREKAFASIEEMRSKR